MTFMKMGSYCRLASLLVVVDISHENPWIQSRQDMLWPWKDGTTLMRILVNRG